MESSANTAGENPAFLLEKKEKLKTSREEIREIIKKRRVGGEVHNSLYLRRFKRFNKKIKRMYSK